ncbi:MAG: DUF4136 domain-containing protein [Deltaproteobacteria bacterium]|nr:DUF4136 domain-containing protein [Deltaproteobacteria bacterium]MBW2699130.1 DUF4136 domain-containing protein [Deltaproteobacteria bacterium]
MRLSLQLRATLLVGLLLASGGSGCATRAHVQIDAETDFSQYRTWGWHPREPTDRRTQPSALDVQIARQTQRALLDRGLVYVDAEPDLLVRSSLVITREQVTEYTTPAMQWISSYHDSGSYDVQVTETRIHYYERGRLVTQVSDAHRDRVVWRGEIEARYREAFRPHLDQIVASLLDHFPMAVDPATGMDPRAIASAGDAATGLRHWPRD